MSYNASESVAVRKKKNSQNTTLESRKAPASATVAARSRHGRRVINGCPAVSKKTSLARERVEERRAREQYRDGERLERRGHVHAVHAVQDLLRDAGVRHALEPSAGHVPEAGLGDVSQARLRRII